MTTVINILGIVMLLVSLLYFGRQINVYLRLRARLGKLLCPLAPDKLQKKIIMGVSGVFLVMLIIVTYNYVSQDIDLNVSYSLILALVFYNFARYITRTSEIRERGILGYLNEITYGNIKSYKIDKQGKRRMLKLQLKDGREFVSLISLKDEEEIRTLLLRKQ